MSQYFKTPRNETVLWLMGPYSISQDYYTMSDSLFPSTARRGRGVLSPPPPPPPKIIVSREGMIDEHYATVCLLFSKNICGSDSEIYCICLLCHKLKHRQARVWDCGMCSCLEQFHIWWMCPLVWMLSHACHEALPS